MKLTTIFIGVSLLIIICYNFHSIVEPFPNKQKPNENQYTYCSLNKNHHYGIASNVLKPPKRDGMYTQLKNDTIVYDPLHKPPYCDSLINSDTNIHQTKPYFNDNKVIDHKKNTWQEPIDPFYPYAKPDDDHVILYKDKKIEKMFIDHHKKVRQPNIYNRRQLSI
jgi:hypothetical protein